MRAQPISKMVSLINMLAENPLRCALKRQHKLCASRCVLTRRQRCCAPRSALEVTHTTQHSVELETDKVRTHCCVLSLPFP